MDSIRRTILKTGAAAAATAAAPRVFAQQAPQGGAAARFYEKGPVRIRFEEHGSGFPLLLIAGGGLNSSIAGKARTLLKYPSSKVSRTYLPPGSNPSKIWRGETKPYPLSWKCPMNSLNISAVIPC